MVALDFARLGTRRRAHPPASRWIGRPMRLRPENAVPRLPLGSFTQGRSVGRAVIELPATTAALLAAIAGFTLLRLHLGLG